MAPLAIDLFCGLGGWTDGLLAEGYDVIGFDIERHDYGTGSYPAQLVLQDVLTLHGAQFRDAVLIVASPPCQAYSYRAMPWSRAKALPPPDNALFDACFRIQREACAAADRHIPMIVENVRGAQKWVGRSRWNFGSYHLWGDVPALMPMTAPHQVMKQGIAHRGEGVTNFHGPQCEDKSHKVPGFRFDGSGRSFQTASVKIHAQVSTEGIRGGTESNAAPAHDTGFKTHGMNWSSRELRGQDFTRIAGEQAEGVKFSQSGAAWFDGTPRDKMLGEKGPAAFGSKSSARKAASAAIARIPFPLAQHLARVFKPTLPEC
jgi:hypothetical protein